MNTGKENEKSKKLKQVFEKLARNDKKGAIDFLMKHCNEDLLSEWVLLSARNYSYEEDLNRGTINRNEAIIEGNKITLSICRFARKLFDSTKKRKCNK